MLDLDSKLIKLNMEYRRLETQCSQLESEIEDLQDDLDSVECQMARVKAQITHTKDKLLAKKTSDINVFTNDPFTNNFIRASFFASKGDHRKDFQFINITDTELQATDAHRLILIKCPHIPNELKNTKIMWDVRENFKDYIKTDINFPDVHKVIPSKDGVKLYPQVNPENFYTIFKPVTLKNPHNDEVIFARIDFNGEKITLNKEYLDTALMCVGGMFDLYVRGTLEAVTFESKDTTVLLMPVRYSDPVRFSVPGVSA